MSKRVLAVDDEEIIRESLRFVLKKEGYDVEEASNGREALDKHLKKPFDVVITDLEMPEMRGIELLEQIAKQTPETAVIIITAYASVETAITALRQGAYDYVLKPIEFDDLLLRLRKLFDFRELVHENSLLRQELHSTYDFSQIIGQSMSMKKVFDLIKRVAKSEGTVLINGRSGTGKELVAKAIHYNSRRQQRRFVPINCGAIVETLFESELFGHKRGAFTGAMFDKEGLLKVADGGTVFLDEVSEIPQHLQVKLLRAIEEREITPVGSTEVIPIDVRIISATNKDLRSEVEQGRFREDLFYRINVVEIQLPSLGERTEDIPILAKHFLEVYRSQMGRRIKGFTNEAMRALTNHTWKGEVRELENIIERAVIFCDTDYIDLAHLPEMVQSSFPTPSKKFPKEQKSLSEATKDFERRYILEVMNFYKQNSKEAAESLGISRSSLYRKMEEYGIRQETQQQ